MSKHVDADKLRRLGFAEGEIAVAKQMEAAGLFELEPRPDLIERIMDAVLHRAEPQVGPRIGDVMPVGHSQAGWIYMGPDDETGEIFYAAPKDEAGTFTFNQAAKRAASIGAKVPSPSQLDKMYRNKDKGALKGAFNETGSYPAGLYWSSSQSNDFARAQHLRDGYHLYDTKDNYSSLRCVRG